MRAPELAVVRLQWTDVLGDIDKRVSFQTEDAAQKAVVIRDRVHVMAYALNDVRHWVAGDSSAQEHTPAVSLIEELLDLSETRSLTAFRSLNTFLSDYNYLMSMVGTASENSATERCTALVAHAKSERRNRPFGGGVLASADPPSSGSESAGSGSSVGTTFTNITAYGDVIKTFLRSADVTAPLVYTKFVSDEGEEETVVDDIKSGLLALLLQKSERCAQQSK